MARPQLTPVPGGPAPRGGLSAPALGLHGTALILLTDFRCSWAGGGGERAGEEEAAVFPALEKNREVFHI